MASFIIRHLQPEDISAAYDMAYAAGWNQTLADWRRLLLLEPEGCFCCDYGGHVVSTVTMLCHEQDLAWLGMVLTHPDYRRRGLARRLLEVALEFADSRGIPCVKLDATDLGRPLYLSLGFADEEPIERWYREPAPLKPSPQQFTIGAPDWSLDRLAFGADRRRYLLNLGEAWRFDQAFIMQRSGSRANYLGPCVARNAAQAACAIRTVVAGRMMEPWFWDFLPKQTAIADIARSLGFLPARRLMRMRRGKGPAVQDEFIYAIAGFEAG